MSNYTIPSSVFLLDSVGVLSRSKNIETIRKTYYFIQNASKWPPSVIGISYFRTRGCQLKKILVHPRIFSKKSLKNPKNQKNQKIPKIPKFQEFWFNKSTKFYKNRFFSLSILIPLTVLIIPLGLLSVSWSVCCQCLC